MAYIDKLRPAVAHHLDDGETIIAAARGVAKGMTRFAVIGGLAGFVPSFLLVQSNEPSLMGPVYTGLGVGIGVSLGYFIGARVLTKRGFPAIFTLAVTGSRLIVFGRDFWGRVTGVAMSPALGKVDVEVGRGWLLAANPGTITVADKQYQVQFPKVENLESFVEELKR
ncbi:MAG: hypothetical protein KJP12_00535 [Acidimicrobiia bacterium]|nr:hypothetical protein [Acidimicrobiia bacterium]